MNKEKIIVALLILTIVLSIGSIALTSNIASSDTPSNSVSPSQSNSNSPGNILLNVEQPAQVDSGN